MVASDVPLSSSVQSKPYMLLEKGSAVVRCCQHGLDPGCATDGIPSSDSQLQDIPRVALGVKEQLDCGTTFNNEMVVLSGNDEVFNVGKQ
ncbi:hypothetical protein F0562_032423 [Nyssa sinensis]|uniref:Uncharacterized protein n=1 Tax=Nyssa sinensis TaxID=561372 RepID=A0A5J5AQD0_9ASTE|nr:hypothetical protein F0562_032423 [Nyssa sinensis]